MKVQTRRAMGRHMYDGAFLGILALFAGCGGGATSGGGGVSGTTITVCTSGCVGFAPPTAMALRVGTGPFTPIFPQSSQQIRFTVPSVTEPYALAWECNFTGKAGLLLENREYVLESTAQDATSYGVGCQDPVSGSSGGGQLGSATGTVDASAIVPIGTTSSIFIDGTGNSDGFVQGASGPFNVNMPVGPNDVAFIVTEFLTNTSPIVGVKILRGQTVPGAINGGKTVTLGSSDVPTTQPLNVTNIPAGFDPPTFVSEQYFTAGPNATSFGLDSSLTQYQIVPAASAQNGDAYILFAQISDTATHTRGSAVSQSITNGGGPLTLAMPAQWSYAGPAPAALPTFNLNYSGVAGLPTVTQKVNIAWASSSAVAPFRITVIATGSYQNGATTITFPDLSGVGGFFGPASSGTTATWQGSITGGSLPLQDFVPTTPHTGGSSVRVFNGGSYVVP